MPGEEQTSTDTTILPRSIRSWIGSDKVVNAIDKLNRILGLQEERARIIPRLILRISTRDLHPAEFTEALSRELQIGLGAAKTIAAELKENILNPIEAALDEWGVDINLIDTEGALPEMPKPKPEPKPPLPKPTLPKSPFPKPPARKLEQKHVPEQRTEPKTPFVIHKEAGGELPYTEKAVPKKRFSLQGGGGFFKDAFGAKKKAKAKVVHFSEHRTSVGDIGDDTGFIDLSKIESGGKARMDKKIKPKTEGNIVDLS